MDKTSADLGIGPKEISSSAMEKILAYSWPGNIRELENVIERSLILSGSGIIYPEHLNIPEIKREDFKLKARMEEKEKAILEEMLCLTQDKDKIIEILGISKASLYEKLKKYGLKAKRS